MDDKLKEKLNHINEIIKEKTVDIINNNFESLCVAYKNKLESIDEQNLEEILETEKQFFIDQKEVLYKENNIVYDADFLGVNHLNFISFLLKSDEILNAAVDLCEHGNDELKKFRKNIPNIMVTIKNKKTQIKNIIKLVALRVLEETAIMNNKSTCAFCKKINDKKLKMCPCKKVRYCNKKCQSEDWKNHKINCTHNNN